MELVRRVGTMTVPHQFIVVPRHPRDPFTVWKKHRATKKAFLLYEESTYTDASSKNLLERTIVPVVAMTTRTIADDGLVFCQVCSHLLLLEFSVPSYFWEQVTDLLSLLKQYFLNTVQLRLQFVSHFIVFFIFHRMVKFHLNLSEVKEIIHFREQATITNTTNRFNLIR